MIEEDRTLGRVFVWICGGVGAFFLAALVGLWVPALRTACHLKLNEAGDAMGPFASLFSALALGATLLTLRLQKAELAAARKELLEQRALLEKQGAAAQAQARASNAQAAVAEASSLLQYLNEVTQASNRALNNWEALPQFAANWPLPARPLTVHDALNAEVLEVEARIQRLRDVAMRTHLSEAIDHSVKYLDLEAEVLTAMVREWYKRKLSGAEPDAEFMTSLRDSVLQTIKSDPEGRARMLRLVLLDVDPCSCAEVKVTLQMAKKTVLVDVELYAFVNSHSPFHDNIRINVDVLSRKLLETATGHLGPEWRVQIEIKSKGDSG